MAKATPKRSSAKKKVTKKTAKEVKSKAFAGELVDEVEKESYDGPKPRQMMKSVGKFGGDKDLLLLEGGDEDLKTRSLTPEISSKDLLGSYLSEIRKYPMMTKEEEKEVAQIYFETKDPAAAQRLVHSNLRFVVKVAAEYSKFGARMIDLIQEGNVGLMHAVREFNPHKGARLITYAVWWIRGYIQEYLMRQYSIVRIGTTQNQRKLFYQLQKQKDALDILGQEPSVALISSRLGISEKEINQMSQRMSGRDVSLDKPLDAGTTVSLGDLQSSSNDEPLDEQLAREEQLSILKDKIDELRPSLNEREVILLEERILNDDPLTLQEIGEKYGITREAVRQAEARLMKKIKDKMDHIPS